MVKKSTLIALLMLTMLGTTVLAAATGERWIVGGQWMSFHYEEPGVMTEDGNLFGAKLEHRAMYERWDLASTFEAVFGTVDYDGGVLLENGSTIPISLESDDIILNIRSTATWWFEEAVENERRLGGYAGFGFRYLSDDLPTEYGYLRQQSYTYIPLGLDVRTDMGDGAAWGVRVEYDFFLSGKNVSGGDAFTQDKGWGGQCVGYVEDVKQEGEEGTSYAVELFIRQWDIDRSTTSATGWYEPANEALAYGLNVLFLY